MSRCKVTFLPHNRTVEVSEGDSLIRTALQAGVHINASCGGEGVCGKCRVLVESGIVKDGLSERLSDEDKDKNYRLACLSHVSSDIKKTLAIMASNVCFTRTLSQADMSDHQRPVIGRYSSSLPTITGENAGRQHRDILGAFRRRGAEPYAFPTKSPREHALFKFSGFLNRRKSNNINGGEGGIRAHGSRLGTHAFEAQYDH